MSLDLVLLYCLVPAAALFLAAFLATVRTPRDSVISLFEHFAAGVVFAAVAVELLPALLDTHSPWIMTAGFGLGVVSMLLIETFSGKLGMVIPIAVDLFIDGMLVAIGFAAGAEGGFILLLGLSLEAVSLGLSEAPSLARKGVSRGRILGTSLALGLSLLLGSAAGNSILGLSGSLSTGILGFGVAALLYLVTEELLAEAHETRDTPLVTAMFFVGFLVPLLLKNLGG